MAVTDHSHNRAEDAFDHSLPGGVKAARGHLTGRIRIPDSAYFPRFVERLARAFGLISSNPQSDCAKTKRPDGLWTQSSCHYGATRGSFGRQTRL